MKALILVDIQKDFCPGGALAVKDGDKVVSIANDVKSVFNDNESIIVATQDYHPPGHKSFASNNAAEVMSMGELGGIAQVMWPDHCVWNSPGSKFHEDLDISTCSAIFRKGMNSEIDSYSGFFDNQYYDDKNKVRDGTGLGGYLTELNVSDVYVMGLATDYCVMYTALDAIKLGFRTHLIRDGCRGVNIKSEDSDDAIDTMRHEGVRVTNSEEVISKFSK